MAEDNLIKQTSELICTRISHDIIGNVGAVANAVELLEEGDMDFIDDIRSILKVSSKVLTARLKFFRLAFGLQNANLTDLATVQSTAEAYLSTLGNASYPITLTMKLEDIQWARPALLAVMILADVVIKGGNIDIQTANNQLIARVSSPYSLANEKIKNLKTVLSGGMIENPAQYATVVYLQNILNNDKKIHIMENNMLSLIIG